MLDLSKHRSSYHRLLRSPDIRTLTCIVERLNPIYPMLIVYLWWEARCWQLQLRLPAHTFRGTGKIHTDDMTHRNTRPLPLLPIPSQATPRRGGAALPACLPSVWGLEAGAVVTMDMGGLVRPVVRGMDHLCTVAGHPLPPPSHAASMLIARIEYCYRRPMISDMC